ncbi:MAG: excinuclease ABC subunit UvrC [Clostridiales bacterium]|nr:excinuclease ABC subunit UvrC [Clostridiales bacterium]
MPEKQLSDSLKWKIKNLPESPGCYIMRSGGDVIYVGKAKNLKNRVRQYFQSSRDHTPKVKAMVEKIDDFDTVLVDGELEALMLECNLIKRYRPRYNILLKDDKHYPFIRIDLSEPFPALKIVREQFRDGAKYFGPYIGASAVREVLDTVRSVFPVRSCKRSLKEGMKERPCLHYQTGECCAPCAGNVSSEEYHSHLQGVIRFLSGHDEEVKRLLTQKMLSASNSMNFERAALLRDKLRAVDDLMQRQKTLSTGQDDMDVIAMSPSMEDILADVMLFRGGKMISSTIHILEGAAREEAQEALIRFVTQFYSVSNPPAREVLIGIDLAERETLEQLLSETAGRKVRLHRPERGDKAALIRMAEKNIEDARIKIETRREKLLERTLGALNELAWELELDEAPRRIEGYDISNTLGQQSVASEVVMINGECRHDQYRHYKIKTVEGANDFASMKETITRRFTRGLEEIKQRRELDLPLEDGSFSDLPDLLLIDGGRGQLNKALEALEELGLSIPAFGLAERVDEIVLPDREETILLDRHSPALHLIERLRDEAHRFAITHHRKLRQTNSIASRLEKVPGIGPARRKAILSHFKTVEALRSANAEEIARVKGVGDSFAKAVYAFLHENGPAE